MSRLDRLVALLDNGSSTYIRNVAAEQIADVQRSRPEELFNLLGRIVPFLQSPKWDTRIASAKAVGLIAENTEWLPDTPLSSDIKVEDDENLCEQMRDLLSFSNLEILSVVSKGTALLGSAGREYDQALLAMDSQKRLQMQRQTLRSKIGLEFLGDDATADLDAELASPPPPSPAPSRGGTKRRSAAIKKEIKDEDNDDIVKNELRSEIKSEVKDEVKDEPAAAEPKETKGPVNARLRALAKRKAKLGSPQAPATKVRSVDSDKSAKSDQESNGGKVVVQHHDKNAEISNIVAVHDPRVFPFEALCNRLMFDMFEPTWETRHGTLLCIREIVRVHGTRAGMLKGKSPEENAKRNSRWLEDLSCRLCCIFALDRFADYVADQAVAPVRESCAQTLGALILDLPPEVARSTFGALDTLIMDPNGTEIWAAIHGGLLGLRYFVTLRPELLVESDDLFTSLVQCVFKGLERRDDDEVQAIAATVLLPIANEFVERRPRSEIARMLNIMWECISDLKDELSVSIGSVMDLLATLCTFPKVLDVLLSDTGGSLTHLVPRLYPFLRHSITDVRKAVLRSLKTFLTLEHGSKDWVSLTTLRLVFQNILLEQNNTVVEFSMELWQLLMSHFQNTNAGTFPSIFAEFWPVAFPLLMTPIGSARRFYRMDDELIIKPSGATYASRTPASASSASKLEVNIDGPMITGDTLIVDLQVFIRAKVNGAVALGRAAALAATIEGSIPNPFVDSLTKTFDSPMSSQHLALGLLLEEFGHALPKDFEPLNSLTSKLNPLLLASVEFAGPKLLWRDINPIVRAVRTQCQSVLSLLMSQNELSPSMVPKLPPTIEGDPCSPGTDVFTLTQSRELATSTFYELKANLSAETQVRMADALEDGRKNLLSSIEEAQSSLESRNTSIRAASAAAIITLNRGKLPKKLNPIIRGLMDEIKTEAIPLLHDRTSVVLANLVGELIATDRGAAASKIVKNLCGYLCVDVTEAPEFDGKEDVCILSLHKDDIKLDSENIAEVLRKEREKHVAYIKRQGALLTLSKLCSKFGADVFNVLPEISTQMFNTLKLGGEAANDPKKGQDIIDNMAVLRSLLPYLDRNIWPEVTSILPALRETLFSKYPVVRHVAARCMAAVCKAMPTAGITFVVKEILNESISDAGNLFRRQGSIECVFHMMLSMGEAILPYIVFFIVPVLGRMSDSNIDVRMIAATTFASIIKLVPLESGVENPEDIPQELLEGKEREREFIGQMMDPSRIKEFTLPITVEATLRKYQQEGVNWLAFLNKYHLHGILCDDMGLGKTLQTICMIASDHVLRAEEHELSHSQESRKLPSLIICPTTLTGHWVQEFNRYVPSLKVKALVGSPRARQDILNSGVLRSADIVVTSYDTARNEVDKLAAEYDWNYCVLDEGHIIKNAGSKLAKAVKQYKAYHRLVLTGTPIQNNVLELWSLFDFLMPGFLGSEKSFNERFSRPISARTSGKASNKDQEAATLALEALHKQVLPFTLRRLKEDVLDDLPPKIIQDYYCELNDTQRTLYERFTKQQKSAIEEDAVEALGNTPKQESAKQHIFQALQYMRKLCNHPAFVQYTKDELATKWPLNANESPKLMALQQLLRDCGIGVLKNPVDEVPEAMSQHRALIFCQQREMLDLVEKSLIRTNMPQVSYLRMDGTTPGHTRQNLVTQFNDDPSIDVLLLTTHVGGLGLNLTGADTVIFVEHDWNPMNDLQAMDRAHRLGQKRVVNVYRLITRGTLEERIMGLQQFKLNIASSVINQQNKGLTSMGTDQILDLFSSAVDDESSSKASAVTDGSNIDPATGKLIDKKGDFASSLGELWDEAEYSEEYNVDNFIKNLKK